MDINLERFASRETRVKLPGKIRVNVGEDVTITCITDSGMHKRPVAKVTRLVAMDAVFLDFTDYEIALNNATQEREPIQEDVYAHFRRDGDIAGLDIHKASRHFTPGQLTVLSQAMENHQQRYNLVGPTKNI